jgi:uncharacterized protein
MDNRLALRPDQIAVITELVNRHVPDAEVWVYGSRANGTAYEGSDLDLALKRPGDETAPFDYLELAQLREAFSESNLPFLVDVLDLAKAQGVFRDKIEATLIRLDSQ